MKQESDYRSSTGVLDRPGSKSNIDPQEIQRKMEAASNPGPGHKALEAFIGNWKAEVKCFHEQGGAPEVTQGTEKANWTLNGHYVEGTFRGEMMGKPFVGRSLMGYDNTKQKFVSVWVSDMQTSILTAEGKGDNGNKVITLEGKTDCPATGRKDVPMKQVFRVLGPDKHIFEMYDASQGANTKTMEITYTRQ